MFRETIYGIEKYKFQHLYLNTVIVLTSHDKLMFRTELIHWAFASIVRLRFLGGLGAEWTLGSAETIGELDSHAKNTMCL